MDAEFDYIVVGSGAGGGVVASRLALSGHRVLVIEAGKSAADNRNSQVPLFHPHASEDPELSWQFFVRHYANNEPHDPKAASNGSILYPRGAAIGGSTAVNAMICVLPHHSDWDGIASATGDASWDSRSMHAYFRRIERCHYVSRPRLENVPDLNPGQHGFGGWLPLVRPDRRNVLAKLDGTLSRLIAAALFSNYPELGKAFQAVGEEYAAAKPVLLDHVHRSIAPELDGGKLLNDIGRSALRNLMERQGTGTDNPNAIEFLTKALQNLAGTIQQIREHPNELPLQKLFLFESFGRLKRVLASLDSVLDPNDIRILDAHREGVFFLPQSIDPLTGKRVGVAEFMADVQKQTPNNLVIRSGLYVSRVLLKERDGAFEAVGVECIPGEQTFEAAHCKHRRRPTGPPFQILAKREVILCAGAFNTPAVLLHSGIGAKEVIEEANSRREEFPLITALVDLPGVGRNLHDRYEISVLYRLKEPLSLLKECVCEPNDKLEADPDWRDWQQGDGGPYATNGAVIAFSRRSRPALPEPDLFVFGLPGRFAGYKVGYSHDLLACGGRRSWSWVILKAHSRNRKGTVRLASRDPLSAPDICFHYFNEEDPGDLEDLKSLQEGVHFVRDMMSRSGPPEAVEDGGLAGKEDKDLASALREEAWGHHACGSCKIGADDDVHAVLSSDFRVRGTWNLRVVDASVFPDIPGFFLAMPVYMAAEKAADVIQAACDEPLGRPAPLPQPRKAE